MAKIKQSSGKPASEVWNEIDSTTINVVGKRVYYQLTNEQGGTDNPGGRKSLAFVLDNKFVRNSQGQNSNRLVVFPCVRDIGMFLTDAPLDSSRVPGTYDLAKEGDSTN